MSTDSIKKGTVQGALSIFVSETSSLAGEQVALLRALAECGSISKAAKHVGISYKTAWDRVDAMNNMSKEPLVTRLAGGAKGGGTVLTALGVNIVQGFDALQAEHNLMLERLGRKVQSFEDVAQFVRSESMATSARNQFAGTVSQVIAGVVNAEVHVDIGAEQPLVAIITQDSTDRLGLKPGEPAIAVIKASSVILADGAVLSSARNQIKGCVLRVTKGAVNTEVTLSIGEHRAICAMITNTSSDALQIKEGQSLHALFKASSVLIMTP
ncbi:MAG TPA: TOBE domain-containing protein [Aliidiomarina sp.]|nr:TOBE domain-containing protein [Aliidiomarina sp.]